MIEHKAAGIKLLVLDVDGVMTDGRITYNDRGEEIKSFDVKDGLGLKMLMSNGVEVAIVTSRASRALEHRAKDLGIENLYSNVTDKKALCKRLVSDKGLKKQEVCCMGDDLTDLAMFEEAGLHIAVADAVKEVREAADFITKTRGGFGAVRETCEWLLKCQGKWPDLPALFAGK
jgi:YrbI family 3-deoxy-D-manno-octulosonate 8-phosphate phosphatase